MPRSLAPQAPLVSCSAEPGCRYSRSSTPRRRRPSNGRSDERAAGLMPAVKRAAEFIPGRPHGGDEPRRSLPPSANGSRSVEHSAATEVKATAQVRRQALGRRAGNASSTGNAWYETHVPAIFEFMSEGTRNSERDRARRSTRRQSALALGLQRAAQARGPKMANECPARPSRPRPWSTKPTSGSWTSRSAALE